MKCKYRRKCMYYDIDSTVCNQCQEKADGEYYCGQYRQIELKEMEVIA